jgi:hypothetical protein
VNRRRRTGVSENVIAPFAVAAALTLTSPGGPNGAGQNGYTGPCPPSGTHHYRFELRASSAKGKVLAVARLVGLYRRG